MDEGFIVNFDRFETFKIYDERNQFSRYMKFGIRKAVMITFSRLYWNLLH
jgi:hypothetical protein